MSENAVKQPDLEIFYWVCLCWASLLVTHFSMIACSAWRQKVDVNSLSWLVSRGMSLPHLVPPAGKPEAVMREQSRPDSLKAELATQATTALQHADVRLYPPLAVNLFIYSRGNGKVFAWALLILKLDTWSDDMTSFLLFRKVLKTH